jgi:uncharacterized surface protein with fasciclin (FAS1) repeats
MISLRSISPLLMTAAIALTAAAAMAKDEVTPTPTPIPSASPVIPTPLTPMPVIPAMPTPTPSVTPMPMPETTPPALKTPETTPADPADKKSAVKKTDAKTIVDVASEAGTFKTLVAALKAADLTETLAGPGPFTVFAPTDKAFSALPKGTLDKLLKPENKEVLVKILTYHVISGSVESKTLKSGKLKTIEGMSVTVKVGKDGKVMVDDARVKAADVKASNGIIHVIDKVIVPSDLK